MTATATQAVRLARTIHATPERLFRAWTDPKELANWWHMEDAGSSFAGATVDAKVGGRYRIGMKNAEGKTHVAVGEYREVKRPTRLVFTWNWEDDTMGGSNTLVTVEFKDVGGGNTEVTLTHERFADAKTAQGHEHGWTQLLRMLDTAVSG
ncbi:MAG: SRPBCC family protein [Gemmatimonadaceae bacterium]